MQVTCGQVSCVTSPIIAYGENTEIVHFATYISHIIQTQTHQISLSCTASMFPYLIFAFFTF